MAEDAGGQVEDGFKEREDGPHGNAHEPEWQEQEPDNRKRDEREQGQRPAQKKQSAPEEKRDQEFHGISLLKCRVPRGFNINTTRVVSSKLQ
jgi:hypothetical protein